MRSGSVFSVGAVAVALAGCATSGPPPDVSGAPASAGATLFMSANLSGVLTQARAHLIFYQHIAKIKIEPRNVIVISTTSTVIVDAKDRWLEVVTPAKPTIGGTFTLPIVDPKVVEKLVAKAAAAAHTSLQGVAYVATVPNPIGHTIGWGVYMTNGGYFLADLKGRNFRAARRRGTSAVGTPAAGTGGATAGSSSGGATTNPQTIVSCIQKAQDDPDRIAACTGP